MRIANDGLNPYALALEEAQEDIRKIVKAAFIFSLPYDEVNRQLYRVIGKATDDIAIDRLKRDARISLLNFANAQRTIWQSSGLSPEAFMFVSKAAEQRNSLPIPPNVIKSLPPNSFLTEARGVPLQQYYRDVYKKHIVPTIDRLTRGRALDPKDQIARNRFRNLAEMEVRYNDHNDNIEQLRQSGARLVVCSSHADCSDRCAEWQGRVYSLDGTRGVIDKQKYVPLETATDVYYTTKAGRTYKNGLLGFNCRHYLTEYRGQLLPTVSADERKKEYAITKRQREYERDIRMARAQASYYDGLDEKKRLMYVREARVLNKEYQQYSKDNGRAYYPMRTRI